ncbi:hypothetical protein [Bradyrhizobium sp. USDA 4473]
MAVSGVIFNPSARGLRAGQIILNDVSAMVCVVLFDHVTEVGVAHRIRDGI